MSSQITISNSRDLEIFLKILAEESVKEARDEIRSVKSDPAQEKFSKSQQDISIKNLKPIQEAEEDEESADEPEEGTASETDTKEESPGQSVDDKIADDSEKKKQADTVKSDIEVSLDSITDTIKMLRSGRSKDLSL